MGREKDKFILRWAKRYRAVQELGGKCVICGNDDIFVLHFHHKDPEAKQFGISQFSVHGEWYDLKKEIDKCILLCGNCHTKHHIVETEKKFFERFKEIEEKSKTLESITKYKLDDESIYKMLKQNYSLNFIARSLKKDVSTIRDVAIKLEIKYNEKLIVSKTEYNDSISKISDENLISEYQSGITVKEIAEKYNMCKSTVFARLKKLREKNIIN